MKNTESKGSNECSKSQNDFFYDLVELIVLMVKEKKQAADHAVPLPVKIDQ